MTVIPIPRDSEKNICPPAEASTFTMPFGVNSFQSGTSMNFTPSIAPGSVTALAITMRSIMNSAGVAIEENFSIPFSIPIAMMKIIRHMKSTVYIALSY